MSNIITYSIEKHKSLFTAADNNKDYFFAEILDHPYIGEPYRAESYAIGYLKKGSIMMQTGLTKKVIQAPSLIALGPSVIRSFSKDNDEMLMDVVFFKSQFFLHNQANVFFLKQYDFFENGEMHVLSLNKISKDKVQQIFSLIRQTINGDDKHQSAILRSYLYILIYEFDKLKEMMPVNSGQNPLFENFKEILVKEFIRQRSVGFYADRLNVTRKYLSEIIKKFSGKTARDWIDEVLILEAKVLLQNKSLTISQISDHLNFSNQSVFGKFFKTATGSSPLEYRKNN